MSEFVRARSAEQKEARMEEVKRAADRLFSAKPYHEITLTTIAAELSWTRANLYKYVTSKEDIFLVLCGEKMSAYMDALLAAFPRGCGYAVGVYAEAKPCILTRPDSWPTYCRKIWESKRKRPANASWPYISTPSAYAACAATIPCCGRPWSGPASPSSPSTFRTI